MREEADAVCAPVHGGLDVNGSRLLREVSFDVLAVIGHCPV